MDLWVLSAVATGYSSFGGRKEGEDQWISGSGLQWLQVTLSLGGGGRGRTSGLMGLVYNGYRLLFLWGYEGGGDQWISGSCLQWLQVTLSLGGGGRGRTSGLVGLVYNGYRLLFLWGEEGGGGPVD